MCCTGLSDCIYVGNYNYFRKKIVGLWEWQSEGPENKSTYIHASLKLVLKLLSLNRHITLKLRSFESPACLPALLPACLFSSFSFHIIILINYNQLQIVYFIRFSEVNFTLILWLKCILSLFLLFCFSSSFFYFLFSDFRKVQFYCATCIVCIVLVHGAWCSM